jgi:4-amino-4-deoxy-L-arabinose transferase-like glycosyltransferase
MCERACSRFKPNVSRENNRPFPALKIRNIILLMTTQTPEKKNPLTIADYLLVAAIVIAVIAESVHTVHRIGPSWDEPVYFHLAKSYLEWFKNLGVGSAGAAEIERVFGVSVFNYSTPFSHFLAAFTMLAFKNWMGEFWAYRMYAPILFGLLLALVYLRAKIDWGRTAALACVFCTALMPRLFSEGHIGATESPLCFFWVLTTVVFMASFQRKSLAPIAGICFGLCMSVKFTGFLLAAPLLCWALLHQRRKMLIPGLCLFLIGPLVFVIIQPLCWHHPVKEFFNYISLSLSREGTTWVPVWFLGKYYEFKAPWYYAPFMFLVTVPVVTLVLFFIGALRLAAGRIKDQLASACAIHFLFFMAVMMIPNAPTYDGVRLFIPAFVFAGMLAGYGFGAAADAFFKKGGGIFVKAAALLVLLAALAVPFWKNYPFGLEYYNELIGGVSGARARGMETTYWWTAVNEDALLEIDGKIPAGSSLVCWPTSAKICEFHQELKLLKPEIKVTTSKDFDYLLMLSRPYPDYEPFFDELGFDRKELKVVAEKKLDGVALWRLYQKKR